MRARKSARRACEGLNDPLPHHDRPAQGARRVAAATAGSRERGRGPAHPSHRHEQTAHRCGSIPASRSVARRSPRASGSPTAGRPPPARSRWSSTTSARRSRSARHQPPRSPTSHGSWQTRAPLRAMDRRFSLPVRARRPYLEHELRQNAARATEAPDPSSCPGSAESTPSFRERARRAGVPWVFTKPRGRGGPVRSSVSLGKGLQA